MLQITLGYLLERDTKRLTPLQLLILGTAARDREGLLIPNSGVPERVYRGLCWPHECLEEADWHHYRITPKGWAMLARGQRLDREVA